MYIYIFNEATPQPPGLWPLAWAAGLGAWKGAFWSQVGVLWAPSWGSWRSKLEVWVAFWGLCWILWGTNGGLGEKSVFLSSKKGPSSFIDQRPSFFHRQKTFSKFYLFHRQKTTLFYQQKSLSLSSTKDHPSFIFFHCHNIFFIDKRPSIQRQSFSFIFWQNTSICLSTKEFFFMAPLISYQL